MKPKLAVVIPTYSHFDYAERAVRSVLANTKHLDPYVIVVDDASPDWQEAWVIKLEKEFPGFVAHRFETNGGLTRSWNLGMSLAMDEKVSYICTTNSDVYFPRNWDAEISKGLRQFSLVGPVTNAPGTERKQYVRRYSEVYDRTKHTLDDIQSVQDEIGYTQSSRFKLSPLNGFCLVAKTETWHCNRYDNDHVFRPSNPTNSKGEPNPTPLMTLNEYEFQGRLRKNGGTSAVVLGSYVHHHRAVSRGDTYKRGDWTRLPT